MIVLVCCLHSLVLVFIWIEFHQTDSILFVKYIVDKRTNQPKTVEIGYSELIQLELLNDRNLCD